MKFKDFIKKFSIKDEVNFVGKLFSLFIVGFVFFLTSFLFLIVKIHLIPLITKISTKFIGSYQINQLIVSGLSYALILIFLGIIIILINKKKNFPWVLATILIMIWFLIMSMVYIQISIGQGDLDLVLRNSSDTTQVIGGINCYGSSESFLLVNESITCKINPEMDRRIILIQFTYENKSKSKNIPLVNDTFIAEENVVYIFFRVNGFQGEDYFSANVGYPYHFLTEGEFLNRKKEFIKYLGIIFAIIFISIPIMMNQFKELSK